MLVNEIVEKEFDDYTNDFFKNNIAVRDFVINHPNRHNLIKNLTTEIKLAELKVPHLLTKQSIKFIVQSFVREFARAAIVEKEKSILSEQALYQKKLKDDKAKWYDEQIQNADLGENIDLTDIEI